MNTALSKLDQICEYSGFGESPGIFLNKTLCREFLILEEPRNVTSQIWKHMMLSKAVIKDALAPSNLRFLYNCVWSQFVK